MVKEKKFSDLFAFDLDGTLVHWNEHGQRWIPPGLIEVVEQIAERAHIVVATGRRYRAALPDLQVLPKMPYAVVHNGLVIKDEIGKSVHLQSLSTQDAIEIAHRARANGAECFFSVDGYEEGIDFVFTEDFVRDSVTHAVFQRHEKVSRVIRDIESLATFTEAPLLEVVAVGTYPDLISTQKKLSQNLHEDFRGIVVKNIGVEGFAALEIFRKEHSKWTGIEIVKQKVGAEKVIAIGDDENDVEMLKSADIGVVMSHAEPHILEISTHRASGPEGLAEFLKEFYLKK